MLMLDKALKEAAVLDVCSVSLHHRRRLCFYLRQLDQGWHHGSSRRELGLYIAQFTFFVVSPLRRHVVLPYYLHREKQFARITILASFSPSPP